MSELNIIIEIFNDVEMGKVERRHSVERMMKITSRKDFEYYAKCFRCRIYEYLKIDYRQKVESVDRVMAFLAEFCVSMQEEYMAIKPDADAQCVTSLLTFLTQMTSALDVSIRFRACQFIANICFVITGFNLTSVLRESLVKCLKVSARETLPHIRAQAVLGLITFQDDRHWTVCPVAIALCELLKNEPFPKVRRACIDHICLKQELMNTIIKASIDDDYTVRLSLYKRAMVNPTSFKTIHKHFIIFNAIYGRGECADIILKYINNEMYPAWLETFHFDYMRLLRLLRIDGSWEDILKTAEVQENVLKALFKIRPTAEIVDVLALNESALFDVAQLDWDMCIYWRVLISHLLKAETTEYHNKIIPTMPALQKFIEAYCVYIKKQDEYYLSKYKYQFILIQLFKIVGEKFQHGQASYQRCISRLAKYVLKHCNLDFDAIKEIMQLLELIIPEDEKRIQYVCGHANAMLRPLKKQAATTEEERLANCDTIAKWLNVVAALLLSVQVSSITKELVTFKLNLLDMWIPDEDINVRTAAIRCFGYYCMLDEQLAKKTVGFFCRIFIAHNTCPLVDSTELLCASIGVATSAIIAYGPSIFYTDLSQRSANEEPAIALPTVLQNLQLLLNDENAQIQQIAGRGLCNFLLKKRILSHKIMVPLILKYFTVDTRDINFVILQQYIAVTLGRLTHLPEVEVQFEKAVLESVKAVVNAPDDSLIGKIDIASLTSFLISLCKSYSLTDKIFFYLGNEVVKDIISKPSVPHNAIFAKMVNMMKFTPTNRTFLTELIHQTSDIKRLVRDKKSMKYITIFNAYFTLLLQRCDDGATKKGG